MEKYNLCGKNNTYMGSSREQNVCSLSLTGRVCPYQSKDTIDVKIQEEIDGKDYTIVSTHYRCMKTAQNHQPAEKVA